MGFRQAQDFRGVPLLPDLGDLEASVLPLVAEAHGRQPPQAGIVHQAGRTTRGHTQIDPVERCAAACLKIWLGPHQLILGSVGC